MPYRHPHEDPRQRRTELLEEAADCRRERRMVRWEIARLQAEQSRLESEMAELDARRLALHDELGWLAEADAVPPPSPRPAAQPRRWLLPLSAAVLVTTPVLMSMAPWREPPPTDEPIQAVASPVVSWPERSRLVEQGPTVRPLYRPRVDAEVIADTFEPEVGPDPHPWWTSMLHGRRGRLFLVDRALVGAGMERFGSDLARFFEPTSQGIVVHVVPKGALAALGFRPGDVIEEMNGFRITQPQTVIALYNQLPEAERLEVTLRRGNERVTLTYLFVERGD